MRTGLVRLALVLVAFGGLGIASCQSPLPSDATTTGPAPGGDVGSISFELALGGGFLIDSVSYDLSGNGFHRADTVDVSQSATFSTLVSGIPVGTGYTATLTAQDVAHKLTACTGSTTFAVSSATTVPVSVHMTCQTVKTTTPPPPPSVPVPRSAGYALAALLLVLGASRLRSPTAS
jgi:hypothetical protein